MLKYKYKYIGKDGYYFKKGRLYELLPDPNSPVAALRDLLTAEIFYITLELVHTLFIPLTPKDLLNRSGVKVRTITEEEYITLLDTTQKDILLAIHTTEAGFLRISDYNDDLKMINRSHSQYDIDSIHPDYFSHNREVLWKRE